MRIHLYGVQGSGSISPRRRERDAQQEVADYQLLKRVFEMMEAQSGEDGRLNCRVEDILGGPPDRANLMAYRRKILPEKPVTYGGWTTCIHMETDDGYDLVFDCGSGFRNCARDLQERWADRPERKLFIFGSHSHRDHTEGLDQAPVCFDPRNQITVYANHGFLRALDSYLGIFTGHTDEASHHLHTPISYEMMPAQFSCHLIGGSADDAIAANAVSLIPHEQPIEIGDTRITPFSLYHPAPCLGYCVESASGKKFVFATDHELRIPAENEPESSPRQIESLEAEARLVRYAKDADLLYRDGQFLKFEYLGQKGIGSSRPVPRRDWGHSCIEDIQEMARECRVKHTLIGHHDPNREWEERRHIDLSFGRHAGQDGRVIELAKAESTVEIG